MVFEGEIDGRHISQGLVGPAEIVFHEPLSEAPIELHRIWRHVAEAQELVLKRAVEPLAHGVVFGRLDPRPIMLEAERLAGRVEVPVKLGTVRVDAVEA